MGRGGILLLGFIALVMTFHTMRAMFPDEALFATFWFAPWLIGFTIKVFLECQTRETKKADEASDATQDKSQENR